MDKHYIIDQYDIPVFRTENAMRSLIKLESFGYNNNNMISLICICSDKVLRFKTYCLLFFRPHLKSVVSRKNIMAEASLPGVMKRELDSVYDCVK